MGRSHASRETRAGARIGYPAVPALPSKLEQMRGDDYHASSGGGSFGPKARFYTGPGRSPRFDLEMNPRAERGCLKSPDRNKKRTSAAKAALKMRHLQHGLSRALKQDRLFQHPLKARSIVRGGDEPGFQPSRPSLIRPWGDAPGWYISGLRPKSIGPSAQEYRAFGPRVSGPRPKSIGPSAQELSRRSRLDNHLRGLFATLRMMAKTYGKQ